jgi:hypothetical protein
MSKTTIAKKSEALEEIKEDIEKDMEEIRENPKSKTTCVKKSEALEDVEDYTTDESEPLEKVTKRITGNNKPRTEKQKEAFKKCLEKRNEKIALNREKRLNEIAEVGEIKKLLKEKREVKFLKQPEQDLPLKEVLRDVEKPEIRKLKRTKVIYLPTSSSDEDEEEEIKIKKIKNKSSLNKSIMKTSASLLRQPLPLFV